MGYSKEDAQPTFVHTVHALQIVHTSVDVDIKSAFEQSSQRIRRF